MTSYLDINGLAHFKDKMDESNESKFIKNDSLDDIINNKLTNIYTYKGTVDSIDKLPKDGNKVGDVYDVADGMNYAWDGSKWDALGGNTITVDSHMDASSVNPVQNKVISAELDKKAGTSVASSGSNGLMSSKDKDKLDKIQDEANYYVHPESPAGANDSGLYKIATDSKGHVVEVTKVTKTDITELGIPAVNTDTTYEVFNRTTDGLVPHPETMTSTRFLREDGTWEIPSNTTYSSITENEIDELFDNVFS